MSVPNSGLCHFSPDRNHRYTLFRDLREFPDPEFVLKPGFCMFIGLNPSTADETQNDPTVARCIKYAIRWGFQQFVMTNIFGYRATDPKDMKSHPEPVGAENDAWLNQLSKEAGLVLCAWGNHGEHLDRGRKVVEIVAPNADLFCLKIAKTGHPMHPLYQRSDLDPLPFNPTNLLG